MIPTDPQEIQIVRRAEAIQELIQHPGWSELVAMWQEQRDKWLATTAINTDRDYLSAQAHTVNVLADSPRRAIEQKEIILQRLVQEELEARESSKTSPDGQTFQIRPPPQAI